MPERAVLYALVYIARHIVDGELIEKEGDVGFRVVLLCNLFFMNSLEVVYKVANDLELLSV